MYAWPYVYFHIYIYKSTLGHNPNSLSWAHPYVSPIKNAYISAYIFGQIHWYFTLTDFLCEKMKNGVGKSLFE